MANNNPNSYAHRKEEAKAIVKSYRAGVLSEHQLDIALDYLGFAGKADELTVDIANDELAALDSDNKSKEIQECELIIECLHKA